MCTVSPHIETHNFYRPHTDYDDAVNKILPVIKDPELKKKYGKRGRQYALGMSWDSIIFDWDRELDMVMKLDESRLIPAEVI